MTDNNKIKDVEETYHEAYPAWDGWMDEAEEDERFYLSDQWNADDKAELASANRPAVSINQCFKACNVVTGYHRQNKTDINYFPVEGADQGTADVYTEVSRWIMSNAWGDMYTAFAFGDAVRTGLGWITAEMDYTRDILNGDIKVGFGDKYHIMMDPYTKNPDLSDCDYILRYAWPNKEKLAALYPKKAKEIKRMKAGTSTTFSRQLPRQGVNDLGTRLNVVEKWHKEWENIIVLVDNNFNTIEWTSGQKALTQLFDQRPELAGEVHVAKGRVPRIKLTTQVEGKILVHDGDPPEGFSKTMFPFFPIFAYYVPNFNDWALKLQGIIRSMKDPQREYNKLRSLMMDAAISEVNSGWIYEKGVVDDPDVLNKTGAGQKIEVNPGKLLDKITSTPPSQALVHLHEQHKNDLREIGPNADMLGIVGEGGSGASAPGVSLQLRQKQGLTSLQNPFDGMSLAKRLLGRYLKEMIDRWPVKKLERIIGRQLPQGFEQMKKSGYFDCIIDEKTHSATYRMANFANLQSLVQHGVQIPPAVLREAMDIPAKEKQLWAKLDQQQTQQAQQQRQMENNIEMQKIKTMVDAPVKEKQLDIQGDQQLEKLKQHGDERLKIMDIEGKKDLEHIKQGARE